MAEQKNNSGRRIYIVAGIVFAFILLVSLIQFIVIYTMQSNSYNKAETEQKAVSEIKENLIAVNRDVLKVIAGIGDAQSTIKDIEISFENIDKYMAVYEETDYHTERELVRYKEAKDYILALRTRLAEYQHGFSSISAEEAKTIYTQEINIFQQSAIDKFDAAIEINEKYIAEQKARGMMFFRIVIGIMIGLLILGEIGIAVAGIISERNKAEILRKQKQAESASKKFKRSQEKMEGIAYTNILTGLKNRYALEKDIGERLQNEPFNIALFDLDNFRSINDIYGYDFGDEYLVQIAEKLKNNFSEYADIYNITGNEFCIVFKPEISDSQCIKIVKNIFTAMGMAYSIGNIGIQLSVSGSIYHYLPGDCPNLNTVLIRMDNVIRGIKSNGGNSILTVNGMQ